MAASRCSHTVPYPVGNVVRRHDAAQRTSGPIVNPSSALLSASKGVLVATMLSSNPCLRDVPVSARLLVESQSDEMDFRVVHGHPAAGCGGVRRLNTVRVPGVSAHRPQVRGLDDRLSHVLILSRPRTRSAHALGFRLTSPTRCVWRCCLQDRRRRGAGPRGYQPHGPRPSRPVETH